MATVVLLGTLDTKGQGYDYLRDRLREQGVDVLLVDAGVFEPLAQADVPRDEVAAAAGADVARLASRGRPRRGGRRDGPRRGRGRAPAARGGAARRASSRSAAPATPRSGAGDARCCPVGVPKLLVSTVASGDTRPYVGATDVSMTYSVVDISGSEPDLRADPLQRGRRDRRDGEGATSRRRAGGR